MAFSTVGIQSTPPSAPTLNLYHKYFAKGLFPSESSSDKDLPSHNLICIQIIDQNFGRACNFEIFQWSRDARIKSPESITWVYFQTVYGNQTELAAIILLQACGVMRPVWISLKIVKFHQTFMTMKANGKFRTCRTGESPEWSLETALSVAGTPENSLGVARKIRFLPISNPVVTIRSPL